jgi:magnesium chelatase family protein
MDRIDVQIEVPRVQYEHLESPVAGESSAEIRRRIETARTIQYRRFARRDFSLNAQMKPRDLKKYCRLDDNSERLLRAAFNRLGLSARGYDRVLKVARTIADLENSQHIGAEHIAEAIKYRGIEQRYQ